MAGLGWQELMIVLLIVLVIFGGAKLPGLARSMGQSIKEFRKAADHEDEEGEGEATRQLRSSDGEATLERRSSDASTS